MIFSKYIGGITIVRNWLNYGSCSINISDPDTSNFVLANNIFGKNQTNPLCAMIIKSAVQSNTANSIGGNVWEDGSNPPPTITNGG